MSKKNNTYSGTCATMGSKHAVKRAVKQMAAYEEAADGLSNLNTMRGGSKGFKGFVGENLEAAEASAKGRKTVVINDNGPADLEHIKVDGTSSMKQMKVGYKPGQIDYAHYKGETLIIDKGNPYFKEIKAEAAKHGIKVVEGHITQEEAKFWADAMQMETKLTGSKNSVIVPKAYQGVKTAMAAHNAGISAAKSGGIAGAGFSTGKNLVQVAKGNKTLGEAAEDIAVDTVKAGITGYGVGTAGSLIASTEIGAAALGTAGSIASTVASAPVIGSAISAGTAVTGAIGGAGTALATAATGALTGAVSSAAAAATSAAAGTALAGGVATLGAGAAAATAAAGALAVTAAPVLAVGLVIGGLFSLFDD